MKLGMNMWTSGVTEPTLNIFINYANYVKGADRTRWVTSAERL